VEAEAAASREAHPMKADRSLLEKVVVATDFSAGAGDAVARAVRLPLAAEATLRLLHVIPEGLLPGLQAEAPARAAEQLRAIDPALSAAPPGTRIERVIAAGAPHVEIIRDARLAGADLIVVGRHGPRRFDALSIGSTAERVVRKAGLPVLVVGGPPAAAYGNALAAVDLSDVSGEVVELALALLPGEVRRLELLHAYHVPFEGWLGAAALETYRGEQRTLVEARARELSAAHARRGLETRIAIAEGDPRAAVLREVVRRGCDLLVAGTHARAGLAHALIGSVAEWLVRAAPCDVAVTRPARFTFELP